METKNYEKSISKCVSWLINVPCTDSNWQQQLEYATLDEIKLAYTISVEKAETEKGHATRIKKLKSAIKKREKENSKKEMEKVAEIEIVVTTEMKQKRKGRSIIIEEGQVGFCL